MESLDEDVEAAPPPPAYAQYRPPQLEGSTLAPIPFDKRVKRHSIHGMMEEENVVRPHQEIAQLSLDEKKFLLAVERGDVASTRRMLQKATDTGYINVNCVDPLGRSALLMAIDNENLEMVELLLDQKCDTKDALLHAISEEFVEAVEVLLDHEATRHTPGEPHDVCKQPQHHQSWEALPPDTATFTPDITPLILAAHRDNYEIIKILLDRGATLPMPHDVRCGCDECVTSRQEDSLRHSRSRINAYRALASPSLIALSSKDPILTAFELSWELRRLSFLEHEFKCEYQELRKQCQDFATALLDHTRSSYELEVLLNHDPTGPAFEHGERMHLNRLKLAVKLRQKKFVAHPNVQQLLASIWYEGLPGFRRKNMVLQALEIVRIGILFPFFSVAYIVAPHSSVGQTMRKPFIKFICHSASYFTFLFLLILASQRMENVIGEIFNGDSSEEIFNKSADKSTDDSSDDSKDEPNKRGDAPSFVEWVILAWVCGLIWSEIKQLWDVGFQEYARDMWNVIDFVTNSLYVATVALRLVSYYQVQREKANGFYVHSKREEWDAWDPMLIAEGLFSAANIFSSLKLVYIFSVNPYLGPLQVSLSRMVMDIMKFFFLYVLVLFAFSCGLNQLLWYYADMERQRCPNLAQGSELGNTTTSTDTDACIVWRRFANLFETTQTLFWAVFGLVDLNNFELAGIKSFTRFWGMLMFGTYSVINIVVLLNLLIAMMNHSYQLISERADTEWKFARSKLWISYFEEGGTVPPPFNIIPTPKSVWYFVTWVHRRVCGHSRAAKKEHMRTIRRKVKQASARDFRYQQCCGNCLPDSPPPRRRHDKGCPALDVEATTRSSLISMERRIGELRKQSIMRNLVRRYVTVEQRKAESQGVTEDDVNEIKQDISAFRCELIEILKNSGMNTATASGVGGGAGGKKNRQKERRLMKGFNIAPPPTSASSPKSGQATGMSAASADLIATLQEVVGMDKKSTPRMGRLARLTGSTPKRESSKRRWGTLIEAAKTGRVRRLMGRSRSQDSMCSGGPEGSSTRSRRGGVAERGDSRDEEDDDDDEDLEDEMGSSCSGSGRDDDPPRAGHKSPRHHGSLSALSAAWGGGLRLVRSLRKRELSVTSRGGGGGGGFFQPPLRLRLLHHHHGSSSTESAPGGSVGSSVISRPAKKREKRLLRASSVPSRPDEPTTPVATTHRDSGEGTTLAPISPPTNVPFELVPPPPFPPPPFPPPPFPTEPPVSPSASHQGAQQMLKNRNGTVVLPNLPGIQPIGGHQMSAGWL
ncbi:transient receptor potential-gamma protein-like isoform X4 [Neocloeon triangulifer]|uniref:transient receptor potential-gamma protein-like isoform X4 n=1 Tax=Neocloeon triangulifer TaxID=2078957 RepID=UPI00286F5D85|nr:transient receptor potential-gamma protein-like isoform X4 [Neocloeon triangulifer]